MITRFIFKVAKIYLVSKVIESFAKSNRTGSSVKHAVANVVQVKSLSMLLRKLPLLGLLAAPKLLKGIRL